MLRTLNPNKAIGSDMITASKFCFCFGKVHILQKLCGKIILLDEIIPWEWTISHQTFGVNRTSLVENKFISNMSCGKETIFLIPVFFTFGKKQKNIRFS